uniref:Uncharacterized protein n=1 Tax=Nelumbo nucifera TaxID=4432 RepID=A0A822ZVV2_NELNU|nr:TPA_asm: hypothetical protein HUJ06_017336 [Nelumbo nucifera]
MAKIESHHIVFSFCFLSLFNLIYVFSLINWEEKHDLLQSSKQIRAYNLIIKYCTITYIHWGRGMATPIREPCDQQKLEFFCAFFINVESDLNTRSGSRKKWRLFIWVAFAFESEKKDKITESTWRYNMAGSAVKLKHAIKSMSNNPKAYYLCISYIVSHSYNSQVICCLRRMYG